MPKDTKESFNNQNYNKYRLMGFKIIVIMNNFEVINNKIHNNLYNYLITKIQMCQSVNASYSLRSKEIC